MSKRKRVKKPAEAAVIFDPVQGRKPLRIACLLSVVILLIGVLMWILGAGVVSGRITEGWGFPMSAVPNWGRPWGVVLMLAGIAYVACPVLLFIRPKSGSVAMMIVSGLSVILGTPLITTAVEIFYNLFQETKSRPNWVDSIWGYFIIINVAIVVAIYHTHRVATQPGKTAPAD